MSREYSDRLNLPSCYLKSEDFKILYETLEKIFAYHGLDVGSNTINFKYNFKSDNKSENVLKITSLDDFKETNHYSESFLESIDIHAYDCKSNNLSILINLGFIGKNRLSISSSSSALNEFAEGQILNFFRKRKNYNFIVNNLLSSSVIFAFGMVSILFALIKNDFSNSLLSNKLYLVVPITCSLAILLNIIVMKIIKVYFPMFKIIKNNKEKTSHIFAHFTVSNIVSALIASAITLILSYLL